MEKVRTVTAGEAVAYWMADQVSQEVRVQSQSQDPVRIADFAFERLREQVQDTAGQAGAGTAGGLRPQA